MEMLHNPVSHQFARALCREEENYLEILPEVPEWPGIEPATL